MLTLGETHVIVAGRWRALSPAASCEFFCAPWLCVQRFLNEFRRIPHEWRIRNRSYCPANE
jgi:hypothetical protein